MYVTYKYKYVYVRVIVVQISPMLQPMIYPKRWLPMASIHFIVVEFSTPRLASDCERL